jgi:hypothetical protein
MVNSQLEDFDTSTPNYYQPHQNQFRSSQPQTRSKFEMLLGEERPNPNRIICGTLFIPISSDFMSLNFILFQLRCSVRS